MTDQVHMLIGYRPAQNISKIFQCLKGINSRVSLSEFFQLKKQFVDRHLWARRDLAVNSGNIADERIQTYIEEHEGEPVYVDDSWFKSTPHDDLPIGFYTSWYVRVFHTSTGEEAWKRNDLLKSRYLRILKEGEAYRNVRETCRQHNISEQTFYRGRSKFGAWMFQGANGWKAWRKKAQTWKNWWHSWLLITECPRVSFKKVVSLDGRRIMSD